MANKFQKSVMERLQMEQQEKSAPKPQTKAELPTEEKPVVTDNPIQEDAPEQHIIEMDKAAMIALLNNEGYGLSPALTQNPDPQHPPDTTLGGDEIPAPGGNQGAVKLRSAVLSNYLNLTPARQAKNKTFYLDLEVIEAVKAAAKQAGVADSKLVNDILRTVLAL